ncbi:MAG: hypothetical protein BVN35_17805 [Proteobacteria bacterium ST_bin11]|nr:MAG: hypothetical protein BVN35_17805 [Proteobacteria bacterium ST_bin11]
MLAVLKAARRFSLLEPCVEEVAETAMNLSFAWEQRTVQRIRSSLQTSPVEFRLGTVMALKLARVLMLSVPMKIHLFPLEPCVEFQREYV